MSSVAAQRRHPRRLTSLAVLAASAAVVVSGCQSRIGVAAEVGGHRITSDQLQSLVNESLSAPGVRAELPKSKYKGDLAQYRRDLLNVEVEQLVAQSAASKRGITIDESVVDQRYHYYEQNAGGASQLGAALASNMAISPALFRQLVRTEVIEAELGYQSGVKRPTEADLRTQFKTYVKTATTATLDLIQLPDANTAMAVLAQVKSNPSSFDALAQQYAGSQGASGAQQYVRSRLPDDLNARIDKAKPGEMFGYQLSSSGTEAYFVIHFIKATTPTFESSRGQLEAQSLQSAATAGQKVMSETAKTLGVTVNPRYGAWDQKQLQITAYQDPAIKALPTASASASATPTPTPTTGSSGTGG